MIYEGRYSEGMRMALEFARGEAYFLLRNEHIGTVGLLLGILDENGIGYNILRHLQTNNPSCHPGYIRMGIGRLFHSSEPKLSPKLLLEEIPYSPRAKKALEYTMEEADVLNHSEIETDHLLLGLLREQDGVAAQVLANVNLSLDNVRETLIKARIARDFLGS